MPTTVRGSVISGLYADRGFGLDMSLLSRTVGCQIRSRLGARRLSHAVSLDGSAAPQVHQKIAGRKRFYKHVGIRNLTDKEFIEASSSEVTEWICKLPAIDGEEDVMGQLYCVTLDGRSLRTPARHPMVVPSKSLAWAIASEWDAQKDDMRGIQPASMPLMSLFSTAIDQIAKDPTHTRMTVLSYLPTDSALFFTSEEDRILLKKQHDVLDPILKRMKEDAGIDLKTTDQMTMRIDQDKEVSDMMERIVHNLDPFSLACLQCMTMECKSLVLSLAFLYNFINLKQIKAASRIEEEFQLEIWGIVEGGHDMDRLNNSVSLSSAATFLGLLTSNFNHYQAFRNVK